MKARLARHDDGLHDLGGDGWWFWLMNSEIAAYKYRRSLKLAVPYQTQIHSFQLKIHVRMFTGFFTCIKVLDK